MLTLFRKNRLFPDLFEDFFGNNKLSTGFDTNWSNTPAVNISENDTEFKIEVAAQGLSKSDFKLELDHDLLTISTEKEEKNEDKGDNYLRREFRYSSFSRSFTLPGTVRKEEISAVHNDGVLMITVPKDEKVVRTNKKSIDIS